MPNVFDSSTVTVPSLPNLVDGVGDDFTD